MAAAERVAAMTAPPSVTQIAADTWRVEVDGRSAVVYLARSGGGFWAFCKGHVFFDSGDKARVAARRREVQTALHAPMPAKVLKVKVKAGDLVHKGDTLVILEAMKMELPLRAVGDARVGRVRVDEGMLVSAEQALIEFEETGA